MDNKRSYLDTLNAGRQRRPETTLEQLNRSLENLESQLGRSRDSRVPRDDSWTAAARTAAPRHDPSEEPARSASPAPREPNPARDERAGMEGAQAASKVSAEMRQLRDELRNQMSLGLRREFDTLRSDIEQSSQDASAKSSAELGRELERLTSAIHSLGERGDDRGIALLRLEVEQVKAALNTLAREETVLSVDRRWDDLDRRFDKFEDKVLPEALQRWDDPQLAALNVRLGEINDAVNNLPESLSMRSLEEKVRTLAGAVDHFARQQDWIGKDTFDAIEQRLEEIGRAIVASAVSANASFDTDVFSRIEARMTALAEQIEELTGQEGSTEVMEQLHAVSRRVDELAERPALPDGILERLATQIDLVAERLAAGPAPSDGESIFRGIEHRFDVLSQMFERRQGDALEQSTILLRDLEQRLDEFTERLDRPAADTVLDPKLMNAIDARFTELAQQIESYKPDRVDDDIIRGLELRLETISKRMDHSAKDAPGLDPALIRSLEKQVAGLAEYLSRPAPVLAQRDDIAPRLDHIEQSIAASRDTILEAARLAAENAVSSFVGTPSDKVAVAGLADDLKALESLTRRSDERNAKTFEAIHDTLLKVVERLGAMEPTGGAEPPPAAKIGINPAPSIEFDEPPVLAGDPGEHTQTTIVAPPISPPRTPAEAAQAAVAALGDAPGEPAPERGARNIFGGFARVFARGKRPAQPLPAEPAPLAQSEEAPPVSIDQPLDPRLINRPLEPGSGAPDLSAILKRVRDERAQPSQSGEKEAGKSDFIAAARRAAQAAAAESEIAKRGAASTKGGSHSKVGEILQSRRKLLLMATGAIVLALAGLQIGQAFFVDPIEVATTRPVAKPVAAPPVIPASIDTATTESVAAVDGRGTKVLIAATGEERPDDVVEAALSEETADSIKATARVEAAMPALAAPPPEASAGAADLAVEAGPAALREAAAAGDAKALFEVGSRYAEGRGVAADLAAAATWYERSAELGFAPAQYRIGNFYEKGLGVPRDVGKAKTWYQLAAAQGNASGMHNLAVLFAMGADGAPDSESAARWFVKAADVGVKDSQFNLGILAAKGVGVPRNLEDSYKWFALVAKSGDADATQKRDEIVNSLSPEQLARARAAVEAWKPQPLDASANSVDIPDTWRESDDKTAVVDMPKAVQTIQTILNKEGYDAGGADGVMGEKTKTAILAFQADNAMKATGQVDETLVQALLQRK